jgi:broad specificity phosphatase PhoE
MLILVRHGRTALNAAGRLQGHSAEPLDQVGERQAKALADRVGSVDELISSPLRRARQTADAFGRPYDVDDRWIELDYGVFEGVELTATPAAVWQHWRDDASFVPEGGESLAAMDVRVREACAEVAARATDRVIAVVSHVSPIKAAVAWALGVGVEIAWRSHLAPGSICRIDMRSIGPVLTTFNETVDVA